MLCAARWMSRTCEARARKAKSAAPAADPAKMIGQYLTAHEASVPLMAFGWMPRAARWTSAKVPSTTTTNRPTYRPRRSSRSKRSRLAPMHPARSEGVLRSITTPSGIRASAMSPVSSVPFSMSQPSGRCAAQGCGSGSRVSKRRVIRAGALIGLIATLFLTKFRQRNVFRFRAYI